MYVVITHALLNVFPTQQVIAERFTQKDDAWLPRVFCPHILACSRLLWNSISYFQYVHVHTYILTACVCLYVCEYVVYCTAEDPIHM